MVPANESGDSSDEQRVVKVLPNPIGTIQYVNFLSRFYANS